MCRLRFAVSMLVVGALTSGLLLGQDKKSDPKEPIVVSKTLPRYFKQLGLTDQQKKNIYKVRATYAVKIEELQRQIADLKEKEKKELEGVLTDGQRKRLKELQTGGATKEQPTEIKDKPAEAKK
jgi:hypothetical protein